MYLFWFAEFIFKTLTEPLIFAGKVFVSLLDIAQSLFTLVDVFPAWLSIPFTCLISIAILFRVSQFIPTIGGVS